MNSLNDICYEHIKDSFYYGLFGDFKLVIDKNTGYFNATKLCNLGGKRFKDWMKLDRSKILILCVQSRGEKSPLNFYTVKDSNNNEISKQITGQYVCDDLILDISAWLSAEFYIKCSNIIKNYFAEEFKSLSDKEISDKIKEIEDKYTNIIEENEIIIKQKDDKIDDLNIKLDEILISNKKLEEKSINLENQNANIINMNRKLLELAEKQDIKLDNVEDELYETNHKLDDLIHIVDKNILPDRHIQPKDINLKPNLVIYRSNTEIIITRGQNKYINKLNISSENIIIKECVPNPITFVNRMRNEWKDVNNKIKSDLRTAIDENEDFMNLYESNKKLEIKGVKILLNNSNENDIIDLFNKLKKEQYDIDIV
ncbi:N1R/p28-like protein [Mythimna separata entomopoxvirus 'L']|uniref:N1R/p28-like protein n=1 Tax=Mythimna separata entomopoxvirus 'L' TaxID=1293572 RepID=A0A916KQA2_9POXV|nr:N1R/p28-like protein [Mythimna separata entomopoxvirus 'L']CCU56402.1 N1R/p28-like protein [Mythimna separata entomopoxvirus 'L']